MIQKIKNISDLVLRLQGIDISKYEQSFLKNSIQKRIKDTSCDSFNEYFIFIEQSDEEAKSFVDSLHNSYSDFFRNPLTFAVLERIILPALVLRIAGSKLKKEIRIWSAATAAGQEAYSLAILLEELKNGEPNKFAYRIFATDQCDVQVNKARIGNYSPDELSNLNMKRLNKWFLKEGEIYTVKQELKENIDFSVFDLFSEQLSSPPASIFGGFDIVICANLLFYYKNDYREMIIKKIYSSLVKGGLLITGESEREILMNHNCEEIFPRSAIFRVLNRTPIF